MKKKIFLLVLTVITFSAAFGQTQVTFYTNHGNFEAEIYDSIMPITGGNFLTLVNNEFYDGLKFYRVVKNFVIQGGNETGNGNPIPDEFDSTGTLSNIKRTISMANAGPNTGSSEIFINLKNNIFLDYDKNPLTSAHPIFGYVHEGWDAVDSIAQTSVHPSNNRPLQDVVIDSIRETGSYLSIDMIEKMKTVTTVYPNPISDQSVLDIYTDKNELVTLTIYNINGQLMKSQQISLEKGKTKIPLIEFGIQAYPSGTYSLSIEGNTINYKEKIIKP